MYAVGIFTKNYFTSRALIFFVTNTLGSGRCVFILSITCFVCDFFLKRVKPRYSTSIFLRRKYWGFTCLFFWQITTLDSVSYSYNSTKSECWLQTKVPGTYHCRSFKSPNELLLKLDFIWETYFVCKQLHTLKRFDFTNIRKLF